MKKIILTLALLLPLTSSAAIIPTWYGQKGDNVIELQEYLIANNYLQGIATGNFYSLTLKAVKAYQKDNNLPSTGYVGKLTSALINQDLDTQTASSTEEQVQETGTTTPAFLPDNTNSVTPVVGSSPVIQTPVQITTINQPVCVLNYSEYNITTNWAKVNRIVLRWLNGNSVGSGLVLTKDTPERFYQSNEVQSVNYKAYIFTSNDVNLPLDQADNTLEGTLVFPNCSN